VKLPPSEDQIHFSKAPCSQTPSACLLRYT
jgi:hypothetical protein